MNVNNYKIRNEEINLKKLLFIIIIIVLVFFAFNFDNIRNIVLEKLYPIKYREYVELYAKEYNVDDKLIYAIIKVESNFECKAVSGKGACGLMQIMYPTAEEVAKKLNLKVDEEILMEPKVNINLGTKYVSTLLEKYEDTGIALAAYNAGSGNVDTWIENGTIKKDGSDIENIPYKETNNYVRKILRDYKIYQNLYN